ncbi:uncharacterized protein MEPE_03344 [Melanopsichium pennsylvanicum]|uniref:Uncharacterized protein n=1 Tax=Melanopsichium pennsylvanicum TaxID=63383 RepID=A0AAJ4XL86_9BASI|nr:uncharacterized protein MEPE_03344 [Melanopsichium pennsylvanicum]
MHFAALYGSGRGGPLQEMTVMAEKQIPFDWLAQVPGLVHTLEQRYAALASFCIGLGPVDPGDWWTLPEAGALCTWQLSTLQDKGNVQLPLAFQRHCAVPLLSMTALADPCILEMGLALYSSYSAWGHMFHTWEMQGHLYGLLRTCRTGKGV